MLAIQYYIQIAIIISLLINFNNSDAEYCQFPKNWTGTWFQKGNSDPIRIFGSNMTDKGLCRIRSGDKYILENRSEKCYRCLVIYEKHHNVLQYKETPICTNTNKIRHREPKISEICSNINGDAPLFSLFRLSVEPVKCPFQGPYKFIYSRGQGECKEPQSSIESCTDDTRVVFKFQACTDVQGSESKVENLECFADWKEGHFWYLVGKIHHPSAKTDEDRFRCFCFEKKDNYLTISQSGDATCDGLLSPNEGSKIMHAWKSDPPLAECSFPSWLIMNGYWRTLNSGHVYDFNKNQTFQVFNTSDRVNGKNIIRTGTCIKYEHKSDAFNQIIIHSISDCHQGYVCIKIYKRSDNIVELQIGNFNHHQSDACNFMQDNSYITLTTMSTNVRDCPIDGVYDIKFAERELTLHGPSNIKSLSLCSEQSTLISRCYQNDQMMFNSQCDPGRRIFKCLDGWSENSTNYLILSSNEYEQNYYCFQYSESKNSALKVILSNTNCVHYQLSEHNSRQKSFKHSYSQLSSSSSSLSSDHLQSDIHQRRAIIFDLYKKDACIGRVDDTTSGVYHISELSLKLNIFIQSIICWLFIIFKLRL